MQIIIKQKGWFKIIVLCVCVLPSVIFSLSYLSFKVYRYYKYKQIISKIELKQKKISRFRARFITKDSLNKNYILLSPYAYDKLNNKTCGEIFIMDFNGHLLYKKRQKGYAFNIQQWKIDGHIRYSYIALYDTDNFKDDMPPNGHIVIADSAMNEMKIISLPPNYQKKLGNSLCFDWHDFILLSDNHYILLTRYNKIATNIPSYLSPNPKVMVAVPLILEVKNDSVIWQWDASNYSEFYDNSVTGNNYYDTGTLSDYLHCNAMFVDPRDNNLMLSFRNSNQIIKVNRRKGEIMWRLGGKHSDFTLTADQKFLRQHSCTLTDNNQTLLLFDNGEKSIRPLSRVLEFKLNEQSKIVTSFKAYNISEIFSPYRGSVQKVGDDYFICGGYSSYLLLVNSITGVQKMKLYYNQELYRAYMISDITGIKPNH